MEIKVNYEPVPLAIDGYRIIMLQSSEQTPGEFVVVGHNPKSPNPYACWYLADDGQAYWGYYCNSQEKAIDVMHIRASPYVLSYRSAYIAAIKALHDVEQRAEHVTARALVESMATIFDDASTLDLENMGRSGEIYDILRGIE